jgi:hypothetical protein
MEEGKKEDLTKERKGQSEMKCEWKGKEGIKICKQMWVA